jgi:transcriptional regulator with XRE-family HTH domain
VLIQFPASDDNCRRCHRSLADEIVIPEPEPPPVSLVAVVPQATSLAVALSANFRAARLRLGLSQRQLAGRMRVPRTYVSKIENLKTCPNLSSLERLARALEVTVPDLLSGGERTRQEEVEELMKDPFIAELQPFAARLSPLQLRAILAQVHNLTLRRSA